MCMYMYIYVCVLYMYMCVIFINICICTSNELSVVLLQHHSKKGPQIPGLRHVSPQLKQGLTLNTFPLHFRPVPWINICYKFFKKKTE